MLTVVTGLLAGALLGAVLQRGGLCAHATSRTWWTGDPALARDWLVGVLVAAVGFAVLLALPVGDGLNRGLALRPVGNVVGGLLIGVALVVARSCIGGLFFKLGAGMVGALVGLVGWAGGELAARQVDVPGPTVLGGGLDGTIPGVLGLPRLLVAVVLLGVLLLVLRRAGARPGGTAWALGAAITGVWLLAAVGDSSFGASSVGAVASVADGDPNTWLIAFLAGLVVGGFAAARAGRTFRLRGEHPVRYLQLLVGGFLLGAGGWIAGGCTLGHGLSGASQLNVSSWLVVGAALLGVGAALRVQRLVVHRAARGARNLSAGV